MNVNVPKEIDDRYEIVEKYFEAVAEFNKDPANSLGEPSEYLGGIFLDPIIRAIQARIDSTPSRADGAILSSYRDFESLMHEYEMRKTTRKAYMKDAAGESRRVYQQWRHSRGANAAVMGGGEAVQR